MNKETQEKVQRLQGLEQTLQTYGVQRQSAHSQLLETRSALEELEKGEDAYRIVGSIMVKTQAPSLKEELSQKEESLKARVETIKKQEARLQEEAQKLQTQLKKEMA